MKTTESGEIVSAAQIRVRPENRKELYLTIATLLDRIRREQGCRTYRFYGEIGDQNAAILVGEWESRDAWAEHLKSDNFGVLVGSLKLLNDQSDVDFKLLAHAAGIEAATRVRCERSLETDSPIQNK